MFAGSMVVCRLREAYSKKDSAVNVKPAVLPTTSEATCDVVAQLQCLTLACPPCLSLELAAGCSFVTVIMHNGDVVPLLSFANGHKLLAQVPQRIQLQFHLCNEAI